MAQKDYETHPAFGMIGAYRVSNGPPGSVVFDSDTRHQHSVVVQIWHAERARDLHHDWIHSRDQIIEVEMSEAQWASFVSSMNTSGVSCTLRRIQGEQVEKLEFAPRLEQSMRETRDAAHRAFDEIQEAMRVYEETPSTPAKAKKEALAKLRTAINNAVPNVDFAGKSLGEHAENVVQKARADIEAMVARQAAELGIEAPTERLQLEAGSDEDPGRGLGN